MCTDVQEKQDVMEMSHQEMHERGIPHEHSHGHVHSHQHTRAVVNRLARAIGHLERVKAMVEEGRDCSEVLIQLAAVRSALNNTGKVILYNVTVSFMGDSINPVDSYVGNIKPGETGNVDAMLSGVAPTMDDGTITISITYEDENGVLAEPVTKEMNLMVTEDMSMDEMWDPAMTDPSLMEEEPSFWEKYGLFVGLGAAAALIAAVVVIRKLRAKKKAKEEEEEIDDEIS